MLHVALKQTELDKSIKRPYLTDKAELVTIVFQAVLLRDKTPHPKITEIKDGGKTPLYGEIIALLPKAMKDPFMNRTNYKPLSEEDMRDIYYTAREMDKLIQEKFSKPLGDFNRQELEDMDLETFSKLHEKAQAKENGRFGGTLTR